MSSSHIYPLSPGSHGLSVVRRRDGRGSGQVSLPHTMSLTWAGGAGVLAASVAGAGVGLVALQHVLSIRGRGGEVLRYCVNRQYTA